MAMLDLPVEALLTGSPRLIAPGVMSAMARRPVEGPVRIGWLGLEGDSVADPIHHGGHDKAIHLYPLDHYRWWRDHLGGHTLLDGIGAFGENIAVHGATDGDFCLGDHFLLGSAMLEVSHGRSPCSKLNRRFGRPHIVADVMASGRAGFYFRVIREGEAKAGDRLELVERPLSQWPMTRLFDLIVAGGHRRDPAGVAALAAMPVLAEAWRSRAIEFAR
jgi:MOSC domain-containing protein YiiM